MQEKITPFNYDHLYGMAKVWSEEYKNNKPYPHIVIDNFAQPAWMQLLAANFPTAKDLAWYKYDNPLEKKLAMPHVDKLPDMFKHTLWEMNSGAFVQFIEQLSGIKALITDNDYWGGGLHQIEKGGKLDVHVDFNIHPKFKLDRRVNLLLYLNPNWQEEYGGHLELWNADMSKLEKKILPILNRVVIFNSTDFSYHGHPDPLTCPEGVSRKSMAMYYYSNGRPKDEKSKAHSTVYKPRPGEQDTNEMLALREKRAKGRVEDKTSLDEEE